MSQQFDLVLQQSINENLLRLGFSIEKPGAIADSIKRLSDFYIDNPSGQTPWHEPWAQVAYLAYYLPLNWQRAEAIIEIGRDVGFFDGLEAFVDFGSGLSAWAVKLKQMGFRTGQCIERSAHAIELQQKLLPLEGVRSSREFTGYSEAEQKTLNVFSYSLTELKQLPNWSRSAEALAIVEPATRDDGRKLLELRQDLIRNGHFIWGPCTHQGACPLLEKSKHDWCHDRIEFFAPAWLEKVERLLPFKNRTITFSYLLVRKSPPPKKESLARLTGDQLVERGKTRQLVCRGPDREFVSWLHKNGEPPILKRGQLIQLPEDIEKKGDELRIKTAR